MPDFGSNRSGPLIYSTVALILAALYVGGVFYERAQRNEEIERQRRSKEAEAARRVVAVNGGERLTVLNLYVSPPAIHPGQKALLCYGVANAKTVTIKPLSGTLFPALSRCLEIAPTAETTYHLTAMNEAGEKAEKSVTLAVK